MIFEGTRIFERNHLRNEASNSKQKECGRFLGVRCRKEAIAAEVGEQWRMWGFRKTVGYSGGGLSVVTKHQQQDWLPRIAV